MVAARGADSIDGNTVVQQAVEDFVDRCTDGAGPDPEDFAGAWPEPLRARIAQQCRRFLAFDSMVGKQRWDGPAPDAPPGRTFGDFVIEEELGRGGMGVVYLAHQRSLDRRVALKVMAAGLSLSKRHVERFRREATAAAQLHHPGIVPVHSFTEVDGTFAFAMDYIAGRNLGEILDDLRLANGPSPTHVEGTLGLRPEQGYVAECALLCAQIASALAAAHRQGIAHRDIKPRNIMLDDRRQARLLDFGLAKSLDQGSISMSGEITGTAHYMSPEQTLGKRVPVDHRTDIFSLGVILHELLTLQRPFDGRNLQQIVYEICFKEPPAIQKRNPKVPRDLVTICQKALEKDPQNRYQTAEEFEADLLRFLRWEPIHARPASWLSRCAKLVQRRRTETAAAALLLLGGLTAIGVGWFRQSQARARSDQLLTRARAAADAGDFASALRYATEAVSLASDTAAQKELELLTNRKELAATEQQRLVAETNLLLVNSGKALERDRELALVLALEAVDRLPTHLSRTAVLDALGAGYRTTRFAVGQQVLQARLSPDGRRIATVALDAPATLWDAGTGAELKQLRGHGKAVDVAFHPDGSRLVTADTERSATCWDLADGRELLRIDHDGPVEHVQFDRRGDRLLTVSYVDPQHGPHRVQVWDAHTGAPLGACREHSRYVEVAAISPCGRIVASCGDPAFVRVWDAATGNELARLQDHGSRVRQLAFAADSTLLATACIDGRARVYSLPDGALLRTVRHSKGIDSVAFDADGERLLTGGRDQTARVWQLHRELGPAAEAIEVLTLSGHAAGVRRAIFAPAGQFIVTAGEDALVRVFDAGTGTELAHYEAGRPVDDITCDPAGGRVLVAGGTQHALLWDLDGARGTVTLRHKSFVRSACFDALGQHAITAGDDETVRVWSARDGRLLATIAGLGNPVQAVDVDPKSQRLLVATLDGRLRFYSLLEGRQLGALPGHDKAVLAARFCADGECVVSCGADGKAAVWNARDASLVCAIPRPRPVVAAALSPGGELLATIDEGESVVRTWSVPKGGPTATIVAGVGIASAVVFHPDGGSLLVAGDQGRAQLLDLRGTELRTFAAGVSLHCAQFGRRGDTLLLCGGAGDPIAQLFDVATGQLLLSFRGHRGSVVAGALSADGALAITCGKDLTARIWPTDPVAVARQFALREPTTAERQAFGLPPRPTAERTQPPAAPSKEQPPK